MKQLLVTNAITGRPDEGIRKFAVEISKRCHDEGIRTISVSSDSQRGLDQLIFTSKEREEIRREKPKEIIYIPTQSATTATFLRAALMKKLFNADVVLLALQVRSLSPIAILLAKYYSPILILTPSNRLLFKFRQLGINSEFLSPGVDLNKFVPLEDDHKHTLRQKYSLPVDKPLILHVGHIQPLRNLAWAADVVRSTNYKFLVVGSESMGVNSNLRNALKEAGVLVYTSYIPQIEEIYQLADVYCFPVKDERGAIGVPLSILEAMACNLPVVTTRFGSLPRLFKEQQSFRYVESEEEMINALSDILTIPESQRRNRLLVNDCSWDLVLQRLLHSIEHLD